MGTTAPATMRTSAPASRPMSSAGRASSTVFAFEGSNMDAPPADDVALNQTYAHALARIFVRPLIGTWVRPNHLTALRLLIGLAACALLAVGNTTTAAWSGVLWIV